MITLSHCQTICFITPTKHFNCFVSNRHCYSERFDCDADDDVVVKPYQTLSNNRLPQVTGSTRCKLSMSLLNTTKRPGLGVSDVSLTPEMMILGCNCAGLKEVVVMGEDVDVEDDKEFDKTGSTKASSPPPKSTSCSDK